MFKYYFELFVKEFIEFINSNGEFELTLCYCVNTYCDNKNIIKCCLKSNKEVVLTKLAIDLENFISYKNIHNKNIITNGFTVFNWININEQYSLNESALFYIEVMNDDWDVIDLNKDVSIISSIVEAMEQ